MRFYEVGLSKIYNAETNLITINIIDVFHPPCEHIESAYELQQTIYQIYFGA